MNFLNFEAIFGVICDGGAHQSHDQFLYLRLERLVIWLVLLIVCPTTFFHGKFVRL